MLTISYMPVMHEEIWIHRVHIQNIAAAKS